MSRSGIFRVVIVLLVLIRASVACGAFEASRSVMVGSPAFDPLRPAHLYWYANPARAVDVYSRVSAAFARPYGLGALQTVVAGATIRTQAVAIAVGMVSLGQPALYRESDLSLALAVAAGRQIAFGATGHLALLEFGNNFQAFRYGSWDLGVRVRMSEALSFDGAVTGIRSGAHARLQESARVSAAIVWNRRGVLSLRAGHSRLHPSQWSVGESLRLSHALTVSADLLATPVRLRLGALIQVGQMGFDFVYRDDPNLGGDIIVGMSWSL